MEFRILGPLEAVDEGRPIAIDRRLSRALLAYLLLHANERVSSERLVDQLWGENPPKTAVASLQNYVSRLRKSLGHERLRLEAGGYVLRVDPERFDLARFDRLVAEAQTAPPRERADLLRAAISLWRGEPLEDLALEEFAQGEIAQLNERLLSAIENRVAADLELGRGAELVDELEGLVAAHPLRERLRGQLMLALYRAGRQADALEAYREARRMLRDELGLEPSDELRALERRMLEQDPALFSAAAVPALVESRRTVTVLFCDVVDSTRLAVTLDPEAYRQLMSSYYDAARRAVEAHGGLVEKFIGDAVMALFGVPELHEDDALRAVRAAVDVRAAIHALEAEQALNVRIAVNTGEVVTSLEEDRPHVTGAAVNVAAHLEKRAGTNEIVLGEQTHGLVRTAVLTESVDLGDGLHAYRLVEPIPDEPAAGRDAPLVGRKRELRRVHAAFQRAKREQACEVVTVVGEAGIGKTRLAREFAVAAREEARVLVGRCVSYGAGATYMPIAEIVRHAAGEPTTTAVAALLAPEDDADQVAQRVAEVVGFAEGPAAPGESFWAVRRLLEALARERPLVVVFDDLHWAEPTLLDLVEYLGEWAEGPILVLCLARRELLESRPSWGGPTSTSLLVELEPLGRDDVARLLEELAGDAVTSDVNERIVDRAGGNPLFAEQLLALSGEAPQVSLDETPPTIEALIGSRLDRLPARELDVLRRASVIGRLFSRVELEDLGQTDEAVLRSLERRALIHPMEASDRFRFHHVLVRDVAYRGMAKEERAELHERVAAGLDRRDGADELIGYHLEQAFTYRVELERQDEHARELAQAAGDRLGGAGIRAWKRTDGPAARALLARAVALLPETQPWRCELLNELGLAIRVCGDFERAERTLLEAAALAERLEQPRLRLRAEVELASLNLYRRADELPLALRTALDATEQLTEYDDHRALGRAWLLVAAIRGQFQCLNDEWLQAATRASEHYRASGFSTAWCVGDMASALYYGSTHVDSGVRECERLLDANGEDRALRANLLITLGNLRALQGRFREGRACIEEGAAIWEENGQPAPARGAAFSLGILEELSGHLDKAEAALRAGCEVSAELGETAVLASRAARLSGVLHAQARDEEAHHWAAVARANAAGPDVHAQALWRTATAKVEASVGEMNRADQLSRQAVELLEPTDALNDRGNVLLDRAEILRTGRREDEAGEAARLAADLFTLKGNVVSAERAQRFSKQVTLI